jgi:phage terminase large subunit GpA-like protein
MSLTEIRTNAYPQTKKIIDLSTPADESGYIGNALSKDADEVRHYRAVCPTCDADQVMRFAQFTWPETVRDPREVVRKRLAHYQCESCGMLWDDYTRNRAVQGGFWQAEISVERPACVGFHLPSWYSPFISLSDVVAAYLKGVEDHSKLMVFITQHKAEVWKETIAPKDEQKLLDTHKTDIPPLIVPARAVALTAGIDAQKFGFWFVVRAWAEDLTSWLVQYGFLSDFTAVEDLLYHTEYRVQDSDKTMKIWRACLDTGGGATDDEDWSRTEELYEFIRAVNLKYRTGPGPDRVYGTKGASRPMAGGTQRIKVSVLEKYPHSNRPIPGSLELRLLDTAQFKALIHWRLERGMDEASGGADASQRFFLHSETGHDYAMQLLSEEFVRDRKGKKYWKRLRRANHLLDAEAMAASAADNQWLPSLRMLAIHLKNKSAGQSQPERSPRNTTDPKRGSRW